MAACVACVPIAVLLLIQHSFAVPLAAFRPFFNDEVTYWHQAATFIAAGFNGGYYTSAELTNASGFTPFGAHGPGFPALYGVFGRVFSWQVHSPILANLTAISLSVWLCLTAARATAGRALLVAAVLCTFWPLLLWAPTAMQESLHHAGAIAMAGCAAGALLPGSHRLLTVVGWPLLAGLAFVRPSWLVLMPVWAVASTWGSPRRTVVSALAGAALLSLLVLVAYGRSTAPFIPPFFFLRAAAGAIDLAAIWSNFQANLAMTGDAAAYDTVEVLLRAQYWSWIVAAAVPVAIGVARRSRGVSPSWPHLVAGLAAMAAALTMMLAIYSLTNATEHRVLSAFLLFAAVLAALAPGRLAPLLATALVASQLAYVDPFLAAFKEERQRNFVWDRRGYAELAAALSGAGVEFQPGADRWCNTMLVSQFPPFLTTVPAGIGLSVVREPDGLTLPARSRYLLLDDKAWADFPRPPRAERLAQLPYGTLYRNLDAACP
jgi:hypothetical protein